MRGSCGPGNLHLINGLYDANRSRVPVLAVAAHIPRVEIGLQYFQETHPQELFRDCSVYCELASIPEQIPHVMESAMRAALERGGVAVVVIPGEVFFADVPSGATMTPVRKAASVIRPAEAPLAAAAEVLNGASRVTILAGAGCAGAHDQLMETHRSSNIPFGRQGVPPTCVARTHGATDAGSDETAAEDGAGTSEVGRQRIGEQAPKAHDLSGSGVVSP